MNHCEVIAEGVKDFLDANIETYLDAISTAEADSVPLVAPLYTAVGDADITEASGYPAVFVVPGRDGFEPLSVGQELYTASMTLWVVIKGSDEAVNRKQMWRYAAAVRDMFRANETVGGLADNVDVNTIDYYYGVMGQDGMKACKIELDIEIEIV